MSAFYRVIAFLTSVLAVVAAFADDEPTHSLLLTALAVLWLILAEARDIREGL